MCLCLLLSSFLFFSSAFGAQFLAGTEDIPLPEFVLASQEETFEMSAPDTQGRLFLSRAHTIEPAQKVFSFYKMTLPQLGWKEEKDNVYIRDTERLTIEIQPDSHQNNINFELLLK